MSVWRFIQIILSICRSCVRFCPGPFREQFGMEMLAVTSMVLEAAAHERKSAVYRRAGAELLGYVWCIQREWARHCCAMLLQVRRKPLNIVITKGAIMAVQSPRARLLRSMALLVGCCWLAFLYGLGLSMQNDILLWLEALVIGSLAGIPPLLYGWIDYRAPWQEAVGWLTLVVLALLMGGVLDDAVRPLTGEGWAEAVAFGLVASTYPAAVLIDVRSRRKWKRTCQIAGALFVMMLLWLHLETYLMVQNVIETGQNYFYSSRHWPFHHHRVMYISDEGVSWYD